MRKSKKSVVVFDFDGTFTPKGKTLFQLIDESALSTEGREAQQAIWNRLFPKAVAGKLTAKEDEYWLTKSIENYIYYELILEKAIAAICNVPLRSGVLDCLEMLRSANVPVAIISYGIAPLIELTLSKAGIVVPGPVLDPRRPVPGLIQHIYAARMDTDPKTGRFVSYDKNTFVLQSTKGKWSRHFADACHVPYRNILAVGDSGGDKKLGYLKENRLAIAKDETQATQLAPLMGKVVVTEDFGPVTAWLRSKLSLI